MHKCILGEDGVSEPVI